MEIRNKKGAVHPAVILLVIIIVIFGINYYLNSQRTITISKSMFDRNSLEITRGDVVFFKNNDNLNQNLIIGINRHIVPANSKIKIPFKEKGNYEYYLENNRNVNGTIIVN